MNPRLAAPDRDPPLAIAPPRPWYQRRRLDEASQTYIDTLLHGEAAMTVFRDHGEQAYVDYVKSGLLRAPDLAQFAGPQDMLWTKRDEVATDEETEAPAGDGTPPDAAEPAEETVTTEAETAAAPEVDAVEAGEPFTPPPVMPASPSWRPFVVTSAEDEASRQARLERERRLNEATLRYAGLIATRRASDGDALLERQRQRSGVGRVIARVLGAVLNPADIGDYRRAEQLARRSDEAAAEYRQRAEEYIAAESPPNPVGVRQDLMNRFEQSVQDQALEQTYPRQRQDGTRYRNRWDNWRANLAESWFGGNRVRRGAIVAPGALLVGAAIGTAVSAAAWPVVVVGLGGALIAGRTIGGLLARTVNRFQAAYQPRRELHAQQALERNRADARILLPMLTPTQEQRDMTHIYEHATLVRSQENLQRKRRAELVGMVAAGVGFGAAWGVANVHLAANQAPQPTATHSPTPAPSHPTPTPNTPPTPTVNVHQAPWNVAHQLRPGHEWDLITDTMQKYNALHGTHLHLVEHANGTPWTWIEDGTRALSPSYQTMFNQLMVSLAPAA